MEAESECPVCGANVSFEVEDPDAGSQTVECDCGASLEVSFSVTVEVGDVEVTGVAESAIECPRCKTSLDLEITDESAEGEVECDNCGATLSVSWSSWGRETEVKVSSVSCRRL